MILNHIFSFLTIFKIVIHRLFDFNSTYYLFKPIVFPKSTKTFMHIAWIRLNESRSFHTFVSFRFVSHGLQGGTVLVALEVGVRWEGRERRGIYVI